MFSQKEKYLLSWQLKNHKENHTPINVFSILPMPWNSVFCRCQMNVGNISSACSLSVLQYQFLCLSQEDVSWISEGVESCHSFSIDLEVEVWALGSNDPTSHLCSLSKSLYPFYLSPLAWLWLLFQKWGNWYKKTLKWGRQWFSKWDLIETKWTNVIKHLLYLTHMCWINIDCCHEFIHQDFSVVLLHVNYCCNLSVCPKGSSVQNLVPSVKILRDGRTIKR